MSLRITTDAVLVTERLEYWTDATSDLFAPLEAKVERGRAFSGTVWAEELGPAVVATVATEAHTVVRTGRDIAKDDPDFVWLALQQAGSSVLSSESREVALGIGDIALYHSSHPYAITADDSIEMSFIQIPRTMLGVHDRQIIAATARRLTRRRCPGALVVPYVRALAQAAHSGSLPESSRAPFGDALVALLRAVCLAEDEVEVPSGSRVLVLEQAKTYIEAHLADPRLTPERVADAIFVSIRWLYRCFETDGMTVHRWIQGQRLERCREDLRRPELAALPISSIANNWGFRRYEHFSRAFKAAYGRSPTEYRTFG